MDSAKTKLISVHGLAERLKVPAAWLKAEANAGRIPSLHAGRRLLFNSEAVERVLLERAASAAVAKPLRPSPLKTKEKRNAKCT